MVEPPPRRQLKRLLRGSCEPVASVGSDRDSVKCYAQVISHRLQPGVLTAIEPGKYGVTREEIGPAFERIRDLNPKFFRVFHHRCARIRRENIRPELGAGKTAE